MKIEKKNGVVLYIKAHLKSKQKFIDERSMWVAVEIAILGTKTLIVGAYVPHESKSEFFKQLTDKLLNYTSNSICLLADWNGVIKQTNKKDNALDKDIKINQGKLPTLFLKWWEFFTSWHMEWRQLNGNSKEYT